jgi:hypothetical protein
VGVGAVRENFDFFYSHPASSPFWTWDVSSARPIARPQIERHTAEDKLG